MRYDAHVCAYWFLVADPFPSFRGWFGTYPVDVDIAPPVRQPRWSVALRPVLALPALVFLFVLLVVLDAVCARRLVRGASRPAGCREECATSWRTACATRHKRTRTWLYSPAATRALTGGSGYQYEEG